MNNEKLVLSAADYSIIATMLIVSSSIGLYFRFSGSKQKTGNEFLLAGRDMPILPVAFSLMATSMSAITAIGNPTEVYMYGTHLVFINLVYVPCAFVTAYIFLPMYFSGKISTVYEYLEGRYGKLARKICSLAFILQSVLYMAVVLYAPALALSAVTDLSTTASVITIGCICTFYCTLGGIKAVLWTDVFQSLLMYFGLIAVIVTGYLQLGGFSRIFELANDGGRLVIPRFTTDVKLRYTMWNVLLQNSIIIMTSRSCSQTQVQRMLTLRNLKRARIALFISMPITICFQLLVCLCGIIVYVKFRTCDPMTSPNSPIQSPDQLLPYYIMTTMDNVPGLPGLCICGLFSAALSTVSSAINSLASVTIEDFVKPYSKGKIEIKSALWAQIVTAAYGVLCIGLSFVVAAMGNVMKSMYLVLGTIGGPVLGIFLLAAFTTTANEMGSVIGLVSSVIIATCIAFKFQIKSYPTLSMSIDGCSTIFNQTISSAETNVTSHIPFSDIQSGKETFALSFMWITPIAFALAVIIGYISSFLIGCFTGTKQKVSPEFLCPARRYIWYKSRKVTEMWSS